MTRGCHCKKHKKLEGVYNINNVIPDVPGLFYPGTITFHNGKTVTGGTALDINLTPVPENPAFPSGLFGLIWGGDVKRVGCKKYQILMSNVFTAKQDVGAATPVSRNKIVVEIEFNNKCLDEFRGTFTFAPYAYSDRDFSQGPLAPPQTVLIEGFKVKGAEF